MSYKAYKEKKDSVVSILDEIKSTINEDFIKERINEKINNIKEDRFTIAVFGHFSNGKSTFLNALMGYGEEVLKEDEVASTATITKLVYPQDLSLLNKARIIYSNNEEKIVDCDNIKEFTARNSEFNVEENIKEVIVYFDSEFLKNGVEIVDTPGFNSTHKLHTDIAKSYIKKADASIFLFAADKPGAKQELKFLEEINTNIDRIFFILNKIDLCNFTENSNIDTACEKLKDKLIISKINMENKKIYPISALKKKESIKEDCDMKNKESMFDEFTNELSIYLTSDENTRDRLGAPVNSIIRELVNYKSELNNKVNAYSSNKDDIENKIKKQEDIILQLEDEIKKKKKHIDKSIRGILKNRERSIKNSIESLEDDLNEKLSGIKSTFSVKLYNFNEINKNIIRNIKNLCNEEKLEIENRLQDLIDELVDDENKIEDIKNDLMRIIDNSFNIAEMNISTPDFSFDALDEIDRELEKSKKEYDSARKKVSELIKLKKEKDISEEEIKQINAKIRRLEDEKKSRLKCLGEGEIIKRERIIEVESKRRGLLGEIVDSLFGTKKKQQIEEFEDDSNYEFVKKRQNEINEQYKKDNEKYQKELSNIKNKFVNLSNVDYELEECEEDTDIKREKYLNKSSNIAERKAKLEYEIVDITKSQYKTQVRDILDNFEKDAINYIKQNKNFFIKIVSQALDVDIKNLERQKEKIYDLSDANELKSEVLEKKIKDIYINIDKNNEYINKLISVKESM